MYGKIINDRLILAPNPMMSSRINKETGETVGCKIYNPRPEDYEAAGYLEIIEIERPMEPDKYYEKKQYVERDGKIYGEWVETEAPEIPDTPVPTTDERITALEGEVDELGEALNMILEGVTE